MEYNPDQTSFDNQQMFNQAIINSLLKTIKSNSAAPAYTPKTFLEQFYLYKNGSTYRLYVYVDSAWKYTALT